MPEKSLFELYQEYLETNTDAKWQKMFEQTARAVQESKEKDGPVYSELFDTLWFARTNGVASSSQGTLQRKDVENVLEDVQNMTALIIQDPSVEMYDRVAEKWNRLFETKKILWRPRMVTNRLFTAAAPKKYTCLASEKVLNWLIDHLNEKYEFSLSREGNWAQKSSAVLSAVRGELPEDADIYSMQTFIWNLYKPDAQDQDQVLDAESAEQDGDLENIADVSFPPSRNTIYYGPPGTGKTYRLEQLKKRYFTAEAGRLAEDQLRETIFGKLCWRDVIALSLDDLGGTAKVTTIIEHPIFQAKMQLNPSESIRQTVWGTLGSHTSENSATVKVSKRRQPFIFDKNADSSWNLLDGWESDSPVAVEARDEFKKEKARLSTEQRFEFITFHQSYAYEDFVEGLRPILSDSGGDQEGSDTQDIGYEIRPGVFRKICRMARKDPERNYALFIDEINRGNISKIFGELITLIEDSKRESLTVRLPYSGSPFTVPKNLYIIGTMNTADRSLALLDTALRRRFSFVAVEPDSTLVNVSIKENAYDLNISTMLATMNKRIELLYDREHMIGHAYFMTEAWDDPSLDTLSKTFRENIIPLLREYFYDDWEKIRIVLGDNQKSDNRTCFVKKESVSRDLFGDSNLSGAPQSHYDINDAALMDIRSYIGIYERIVTE